LCIGLLAFWLDGHLARVLGWQKLAFILGGLMLPRTSIHAGFKAVAALTPFPAILGGTGVVVLSSASARPGLAGLQSSVWCTATGYAAVVDLPADGVHLTVNGG
jgi:ABC-type uncharacterized transport system permease subunit